MVKKILISIRSEFPGCCDPQRRHPITERWSLRTVGGQYLLSFWQLPMISSEKSVWRQRKKMKGRPWDEKAPNDQRFLWIERSTPEPKTSLCCLCHCRPEVDFKNIFKYSSGMWGYTSGSREKLFRPWGRLKFWMILTFSDGSFLHNQVPLGTCGTGYVWNKGSSGSQFCQHSSHSLQHLQLLCHGPSVQVP